MTTAIQAHDPSLLSRYLAPNPLDTAKNHECKARLYCAAMIISGIGAAILFGSITALYLGLLSEASLTGMEILGLIVGACVCIQGVDTFSKWQIEEDREASWHVKIHAQLESIRNWNEEAIQQFFTNQHRTLAQIQPTTMQSLQQINPARPLLGLLPLIARYQVCRQAVQEWDQKAAEQANAIRNLPQLRDVSITNLYQIYQSLEAKAKQEKTRYDLLSAECLSLIG